MLKNQLTSTPKLRIIKTEWGAFGKRSAHRKIQEVSLKWVNPDPSEEEIKEYLAGNLCRCSGYEGQLRGILNFLAWKKQQGGAS